MRTRPPRRALAITVVALLLAAFGPALAMAQPGTVSIKVTDAGVSLEAVDAPLDQVLSEIGRALHTKIMIENVLAGDLAKTRVTRSFTGLSPDVVFRRLLDGRNYALVQSQKGVDELRVFVDGKAGYRELTRSGTRATRARPPASSEERPDDPAEVGRLRQAALTAADPSERQRALEDLSQIRDTAILSETLTQALAGERDSDVLQALVDLVGSRPEAVSADALRAFVASDRDARARTLAVYQLGEEGRDDATTRTLLRTLAARDANADVRDAAQNVLESLEDRPEAAPSDRRSRTRN